MNYSQINWEKCYKVVLKLQNKIIVAWKEKKLKKVLILQDTLIKTFEARAIAVRKITTTLATIFAGLGKIKNKKYLLSNSQKLKVIFNLGDNKNYEASPIKKVKYLKTNPNFKRRSKNKKITPLFLPSIFDLALQNLYHLALDPIAEEMGSNRSYGFRPYRGILDIQRYLRQSLALGNRARYILKGQITNLFNQDSKNWILKNIPINKKILLQWLNQNYFDSNMFFQNKFDFQGKGIFEGVYSPIAPNIANIQLNGLEDIVTTTRKKIEKDLRKKYKKATSSKINFVRFANSFILTSDKKSYFKEVLLEINKFLSNLSLNLNFENIKIYKIQKGFDFLGFNFRKYQTFTRENKEILLIKPSKLEIKKIKLHIKSIFQKYTRIVAVLNNLNPVLKDWGNIYKFTNSKRIFSKIDTYVFYCLLRWIKRIQGRKQIKKKLRQFFKKKGNKKWNFEVNFKGQKYFLVKLSEIPIDTHVIVQDLNPYLKENNEYFKKRYVSSNFSPLVQKLLERQKNICPVCEQGLMSYDQQLLEVHHILARSDNGTNQLKNLLLLHNTCHQSVTYCKDPELKAKFLTKGIIR